MVVHDRLEAVPTNQGPLEAEWLNGSLLHLPQEDQGITAGHEVPQRQFRQGPGGIVHTGLTEPAL
jgi:hypothetical protein